MAAEEGQYVAPSVKLATSDIIFLVIAVKARLHKWHECRAILQKLDWIKNVEPEPQVRMLLGLFISSVISCWQFDYFAAEDEIKEVLVCFGQIFGLKSPEYLYALALLGYILLYRGQFSEALQAFTTVV